MYNISTKLRSKLFKFLDGPSFSNFKNDEMPAEYKGRIADLFYSNTGHTIHKWPHYLPIYEQLFSQSGKSVRFLEIGVYRGGSLGLWRKYFGPEATIFGVDIDPDCSRYDGVDGQVRIGSQDDAEFLQSVVAEMGGVDIILDDGSHIARHQRASLEILFPLLNEGGLYVIEDMHTSYWPTFEGGLKRKGTAIEVLKGKLDAMHRHYYKSGINTSDQIPEIESIQFFDSIAAIRKARQCPRYTMMVPSDSA